MGKWVTGQHSTSGQKCIQKHKSGAATPGAAAAAAAAAAAGDGDGGAGDGGDGGDGGAIKARLEAEQRAEETKRG